jgi:Holliday junction resolvasome RuvABC endonuclease subunit
MYAGIDYSLTCPAITIGNSKDFKKCKTFFYSDQKTMNKKFGDNIYGMMHVSYSNEMERIENISEWAMTILKKFKVTYVCLEDYSYGSKGRVFHLAENTGLLKYKMWKEKIPFIVAAPTQIKKYFTTKGNANKILMHDSFVAKTGIDLSTVINKKPDANPISDIVDSYAMLCYGIDKDGESI